MLSYKEIIKINNDWATAHKVIQNFGAGERWQVVEHDQDPSFKYPLMFMEDVPHSSSKGEYVYSFRIWFVTRVESPEDRGTDLLFEEFTVAKNSMIQCAKNLIAYWVQDNNYPTIDVNKSFSIETFIDQTEDKITGCWLDVQFTDVFNYDNCLLPMDSLPTPPSTDVVITINGATWETYAAGTTNDIVVKDTDGTAVGSKVGSEWIVPASGGGSFTYDVHFDGVDSGQDVVVDGSNITINLT